MQQQTDYMNQTIQLNLFTGMQICAGKTLLFDISVKASVAIAIQARFDIQKELTG
jgi:hypothetical protein